MADTDEPDVSQMMHVGMLLRCFLCHETLPEPDWDTKRTYPEWKGSLVSAQDGSIRQQLRSTHIQETKLQPPNKMGFWSNNAIVKELSIRPCDLQIMCGDYCPDCRPDRMVYLSHRDCWKIAFSSSHPTFIDWSRLAAQTRPFEIRRHDSSVGCHDQPGTIVLPSMPPDPDLLHAKTFVSELPHRLRTRPNWTLRPEIKPLQRGSVQSSAILSCCSTEIMGRPYLNDLALEPLKGSTAQVIVANIAIRGLQFALGRFGLRGIRVSYEDGSFSPWLGDPTSCWVGIVRCSDLSKLDVVTNFQYLPLSFGTEYASGLTVYVSYGFDRIYGIVSHGLSDFVFGEAEYEEDKHEETYHAANDGLEIQLGTNLGRVQHFGAYQWPEQVDIANGVNNPRWVRLSMERSAKIHGLAFDVPKYTCEMKTVYGFGVSQDATLQLGSDEADKPPLLPIHARGPTLPTPEFTNYLRREKTGFGLSTASLNNIKTLHVRKKMVETPTGLVCGCVGLRIVHLDSSIETLGRWDPRDKHSISRLYDSSEGILKTVTFHMADVERATHVENITVGVTDSPWDSSMVVPVDPPNHPLDCSVGESSTALTNARTFDCSQGSQRVAWWFTSDYDDIGCDYGIPGIQFEEETNLFFGEEYEDSTTITNDANTVDFMVNQQNVEMAMLNTTTPPRPRGPQVLRSRA
ncbi:hypothetical protein LA080_002580 [Diaporthe eres]|nr:hypothetical protein LA080_002580 [Diaporthe eres]